MKRSYIALTLALLAATAPATANDESLSMRAASSLSLFVTSQGNAALKEIRNELKKDLLTRLKLYLPQQDAVTAKKPAANAPLTP